VPALPTVEQAWRWALYGSGGFYRRAWPAEHFATATHRGRDVARVLVALARRTGADAVVDLGAGAGELLVAVHAEAPDLELVAVELRPRPAGLPDAVRWLPEPPRRVDAVLVGHELLDTVPGPVVQADAAGLPRVLHVDPSSGHEHPGAAVAGADAAWLARWWPLAPGERAEVGRARDDVWAAALERLGTGLAVAVDHGHVRRCRPAGGSLRAYAGGRRVPLAWDGRADVTADVALDALAARVGGTLRRQRDLLAGFPPETSPHEWRRHGDDTPPGPPDSATGRGLPVGDRDGATRLRAISRAGETAEVAAAGGLGEVGWVLTPVGVAPPWPA